MKRPVFAYIFISLISCMLIILPSPEHQLHAEKSINEKMLKREKGFELGGFIGTPSGLNMRYWFTGYIGLESTMGISLDYAPACTLDLLVQHIRIYRGYSWDLNLFYGVGTMAAYENSAFLGKVRIPLGFSIPLADTPISFSVTIAPSLVYYPSRQFDLNWGIGVRYNFTQASSTKREVSYLKNRLYGLEHGLSTTEGKLDKTRGELANTRGELDSTRGELADTKGRLIDTEGKLVSARKDLNTMKKQLDDTKVNLDDTKNRLQRTSETLTSKKTELDNKQQELNNAKNIIKNAFTGSERQKEEKKLAKRQEKLNKEISFLKREKAALEKRNKVEKVKRKDLKIKCESRRGIINASGYCVCRKGEKWNDNRSSCICLKGYKLNSSSNRCEPCKIINYYGQCREGCYNGEVRSRLKSGPHTYVCIKRCRKKHETWSKRKGSCVCRDGYSRGKSGECESRR